MTSHGTAEDVERAWRRIMAWLGRHAPVTASAIRPPAPENTRRATENAIAESLPAELLGWWSVMDGMDDNESYRAGFVVPDVFMPLTVERVLEEYLNLSRFPDFDCCGEGDTHRKQAGETGLGFCGALVPICRDLGGDILAVDLRAGDRRGCVIDWKAEDAYLPSAWPSVAAMLTDTADRLDNHALGREPTGTATVPTVVDDGVLIWDR